MPDALVEVRGLRVCYGSNVAVGGVDFAVAPGEVVGLLGKNGAGKSTLIKVLAGGARASAGEVRLRGTTVDLARHTPSDAQALGLAVMFQELEIFPGMTVAENVAMGSGLPHSRLRLVDGSELTRRVRETLEAVGSRIEPRTGIDRLSPAEQRTVMIARALYHDAQVLVLDEPTTSLTAREIDALHELIRRLAARGHGVVYVSHRLDEVLAVTDRVVIMRDGLVTADRPTSEMALGDLIAAISGKDKATTAAERRAERGVGERTHGPVRLAVSQLSRPGRLHDVSFQVRAGEILGIAGLVGSGRTELLRAIFGADRLARGEIRIDDRLVRVRSPRSAVRHGIVLLPEDRRHEGLVDTFGIRENITLATLPAFRWHRLPVPSRRRELAATRRLVGELGVRGEGPEQLVSALSGGNQQKVVIAKWMLQGGTVLMFDEPTQGIDVEAKEEVYGLMEGLAAEGAGVVLVSSEFAELVAVCSRVIVLREGRLVATLDGAAMTERAITDACYAAPLITAIP